MSTHVLIVGAYGSAGVSVAEGLLDAPDVRLTLVDNGVPGGGLCILRGCMPSKEVLSSGAHRYQPRHDRRLVGPLPDVDLERVVETKDEHVHGFARHRRDAVHGMAEREHVEFFHESARFVGDRTVEVGDRQFEPDYVVIATGSRVNVPSLPGIENVPYMTSADVLDATSFQETGIVMGFGYVGLELVPYLVEAGGMDITVIEHDDRPIDEADPAFGDELMDIYRSEFDADILPNVHERTVGLTDDGRVELTVERDLGSERLVADQLFTFTGRRPNLDGLGIEETSITPEDDWVHDTMQARDDPHVFVVGDVNGKEPILHVAKEQGYAAAENILAHRDGEALTDYENVHHHVIFSGLGIYPYARVGHSERSAEAEGLDYHAVTRRASDDGVFKTKTVPDGLASLVVDATDGTVLGYQGLHFHADVMAKTMQVVIELGLDVRELPDRAYHPTTPEILDGLFREASAQLQ